MKTPSLPPLPHPTLIWPLSVGLALLGFASSSQAVDYYWKGTGNINATANWGTNLDGTGTSPANFTTSGNTFIIQNGQSPVLAGAWTISGTGSNLLIQAGGVLNTGANDPSLTLNLQSGATYIMNNSSYGSLSLGTLDPGSTFQLNNQSNPRVAGITYGNLRFNGTGNVSLSGNLSAAGTLSVTNTGQLRLTSAANVTHSVSGDLTLTASSLLALTNGAGTMTLNLGGGLTNSGIISKSTGATTVNFSGTGSSNATWGAITTTNFSNASFNINSSKTLVFIDSVNLGAAAFSVSGTLNIGGQVLSGTSGTFLLGAGGTLITSNAAGLNGAITVTGTRTFNAGANYEFQGAGTGALLPATANNLTINRNSGNVTLDGSGTTQTLSGSLSVLSGNLEVGVTKTTVNTASLTMRNAQINSGVTTNLTGNVTFDATNNGTATIAGAVGLGGSTRTFNIADGAAATDMNVSGAITNSAGGILKSGNGTLALSSASNTFSGTTEISAGTLLLGVDGALSPNAAVTLSGGTLSAAGNGSSALLLSSSGTSAIDFGAGSSADLSFSGIDTIASGLKVWNWSGSAQTPGGGSVTRILVGSGVENTAYPISFYSGAVGDNDSFIAGGGYLISNVNTGGLELVAVPEVGALFGALGLLAPLAYRERRHWMRCREARTC